MGDIFVFSSPNDAVLAPGKWKGNEVVMKRSVGNLAQKPKLSIHGDDTHLIPKDYTHQLYQENLTLIKLIGEQNKTIESHGIELQKLRVNLQKAQLQNCQLAQSNSQLLAQLNAGKDKLKLLQHELACKNSLLTAKTLESRVTYQNTVKKEGVSTLEDDNDNKPGGTNGRRHSKACGPSVSKSTMSKENLETKRLSLRRRSSRFKSEEHEPAEDMFDVSDAEVQGCPQSIDKKPEDFLNSVPSLERSEQVVLSLESDVDDSRPCSTNTKRPRKARRISIVEGDLDSQKIESKRPCRSTRSLILKSEELEVNENIFETNDTKMVVSPQNDDKKLDNRSVPFSSSNDTKDVKEEEAVLSIAQKVRGDQDVKVCLQGDIDARRPLSSKSTGKKKGKEPSTGKGASDVEKAETKRACPSTRRQSSRLKSKGDPSENTLEINPTAHLDNIKLEESCSMPSNSSDCGTKKIKREKSDDDLCEQVKRFSEGRPLRRAAVTVQSYREIPLNVKMRRPE